MVYKIEARVDPGGFVKKSSNFVSLGIGLYFPFELKEAFVLWIYIGLLLINSSLSEEPQQLRLRGSAPSDGNCVVLEALESYLPGEQDFGQVNAKGCVAELEGNAWKIISQPQTVTFNTVLRLNLEPEREAEIYGILFIHASGNSEKDFLLQLSGTQDAGSGNLKTAEPAPIHRVVELGKLVQGEFSALVLVADDDENSNAKARFSQITLSEKPAPFIPDENFPLALGRDTLGKLYIESGTEAFGRVAFGHVRANYAPARPVATYDSKDEKSHLYYNLVVDGYGGFPQGSCLKRSELLAVDDPTKEICQRNENQDMFRVWHDAHTQVEHVLMKNVEVKNAFRTHAATKEHGQSGAHLPHTDVLQAYQGFVVKASAQDPDPNEDPLWWVVQDSVFKNSDDNIFLAGNTRFDGIVMQNVSTGCDAWYRDDFIQRRINDLEYIGLDEEPVAGGCSNNMVLGSQNRLFPVWLINVKTGDNRAVVQSFDGGDIVVIGENYQTLRVENRIAPGPFRPIPGVCRYRFIEDALNDSDDSDGCGIFFRPPFIHLSCSGWRTPPEACESPEN